MPHCPLQVVAGRRRTLTRPAERAKNEKRRLCPPASVVSFFLPDFFHFSRSKASSFPSTNYALRSKLVTERPEQTRYDGRAIIALPHLLVPPAPSLPSTPHTSHRPCPSSISSSEHTPTPSTLSSSTPSSTASPSSTLSGFANSRRGSPSPRSTPASSTSTAGRTIGSTLSASTLRMASRC